MPPNRKLRVFSLRASLVAVVGIAALLGWYVSTVRAQRLAVGVIRRSGGRVDYDYMYKGEGYNAGGSSWAPTWLRRSLGDDYFHRVVSMRVEESDFGDEDLRAISALLDLHTLCVYRSKITDEGLSGLSRRRLRALWLGGNPITDVGLDRLGDDLIGGLDILEFRGTGVTRKRASELQSKFPKLIIFAEGPSPGERQRL